MTLGEYLKAATRQRWQAGAHDCCTFAGDWALSWGLGDPMAAWRGRYTSDRDAYRLIGHAGGLVTLWRQGLASIGVGEVATLHAIPGDIGVIAAIGEAGPEDVGAIWTGERWALRAAAGVTFVPAVPIAIWGPRHG